MQEFGKVLLGGLVSDGTVCLMVDCFWCEGDRPESVGWAAFANDDYFSFFECFDVVLRE
jgi:hypothetical protein